MKKVKDIIIWISKNIILVGFIICLIIIVFLWLQNKSLNKKIDIKNVQLMAQTDSTKEYKTKAGEYYYKANGVIIENNALKGSLETLGIENKDLRDMNIKKANLISALKLELASAGHIVTIVKDSIIYENVPVPIQIIPPWNNKHLFLTNGIIKNKQLNIDYLYKANLFLTSEKKGQSVIVTGKLDDENAKIVTASQIIVVPTTRWWKKPWVWGIAGMATGIFISK